MNLQTKIKLVKQSKNLIDYNSDILLIGSCFSENIGDKLEYFKFQNIQNPFGILFQPKAIENLVSNAVEGKVYSDTDVFFNNEQWQCFDAHSKLSSTSKDNIIQQLNTQIKVTASKLKTASHIIITLGTAWVYRDVKTGHIVANCHKVSQKQFKKELLSINDILNSLHKISEIIKSVNSKVSVIFTVSPVRHLKDGVVENMQSKAHLISGIHEFLNQKTSIEKKQSHYFPSYEIMMDELRDYRFYNDDMIHPSSLAINYIWNRFKSVWLSETCDKTMDAIEGIQRDMAHKPFNPNSTANQYFLQKLETKKQSISNQFPHIVF
ncbi:GSCFA domain-containing protein [Hyunsoonleella sp. 2307UL5-6]|uniref:GSCFA domain-containing protein n=1 Tax=Hyunsoonleella sp. 2307UL5-6 TaxID=3384768 RepID=UPI0039BD6E31